MSAMRVMITGGYGCIGSETAKWLLKNSAAEVVLCSRHVDQDRTQRVFEGYDLSRLIGCPADVRNQDQLEQLLRQYQVTHVIHLAALQTPDCNAYRDLGLQINLAGTQNLIEAIKNCHLPLKRFVFASSIAVYGPRAAYPPGKVPMLAEPQPVNVYGAWKLAGEYVSRYFQQDTGIATVCLRPGVLFGPGRDAGLTSSPTTAMKCVALGLPFQIPFRTLQDYLYAPDVGAAFAHAAIEPFDGFCTLTLPSHSVDTTEMVELIRSAAVDLKLVEQFDISIGNDDVPFVSNLEFDAFTRQFPNVRRTALADAVRSTIEVYLAQVQRGWLTKENVFD